MVVNRTERRKKALLSLPSELQKVTPVRYAERVTKLSEEKQKQLLEKLRAFPQKSFLDTLEEVENEIQEGVSFPVRGHEPAFFEPVDEERVAQLIKLTFPNISDPVSSAMANDGLFPVIGTVEYRLREVIEKSKESPYCFVVLIYLLNSLLKEMLEESDKLPDIQSVFSVSSIASESLNTPQAYISSILSELHNVIDLIVGKPSGNRSLKEAVYRLYEYHQSISSKE